MQVCFLPFWSLTTNFRLCSSRFVVDTQKAKATLATEIGENCLANRCDGCSRQVAGLRAFRLLGRVIACGEMLGGSSERQPRCSSQGSGRPARCRVNSSQGSSAAPTPRCPRLPWTGRLWTGHPWFPPPVSGGPRAMRHCPAACSNAWPGSQPRRDVRRGQRSSRRCPGPVPHRLLQRRQPQLSRRRRPCRKRHLDRRLQQWRRRETPASYRPGLSSRVPCVQVIAH